MMMKSFILAAVLILGINSARAESMVTVGEIEVDQTEVTVAAFRGFVRATGLITEAEKAGGGGVYEAGWVQKPGWTWQQDGFGPVRGATGVRRSAECAREFLQPDATPAHGRPRRSACHR